MMGGSFLAGGNPARSPGAASARRTVATERRDLTPGSSHATARYGQCRCAAAREGGAVAHDV